jgi:hypothetical protein
LLSLELSSAETLKRLATSKKQLFTALGAGNGRPTDRPRLADLSIGS